MISCSWQSTNIWRSGEGILLALLQTSWGEEASRSPSHVHRFAILAEFDETYNVSGSVMSNIDLFFLSHVCLLEVGERSMFCHETT